MGRKERRAAKKGGKPAFHEATSALNAMLQDAIAHHRAGRLTEAEKLHRQILSINPNSIDSLHLLGLISFQAGDCETAIDLIGKAIQIRDNIPLFHYNLANAFLGNHQVLEAITHFERAIALKSDYAEAYNNLGYIFLEQGVLEKTIMYLDKALAINPNYAEAHNNLGLALKAQGKFDEALVHFKQAIALKPDHVYAQNNLGMILRTLGKPDEALPHYERALALQPHYIEALNNLGNALRDMGQLDKAKVQLEHALTIDPDCAEAYSNLGNILKDRENYDEAIARYERAIALKPGFATAYYNIGTIYQETGRHHEAMAYYERALTLQPDYGDALWNQSLLFLLTGNFEKGWKQYERRWLHKDIGDHGFRAPLWDGGSLEGKTILLHCEQGLGDSLQFIRYAPMVKQRGGRVLLVCPPALVRIFESAQGIDRIIPEGQPIPPHDCRVPLLSLPLIFNTALETIPATVPYLTAPVEQVASWAERMKPHAGLKVGLVWAGNPRKYHADSHAVDRRRSMSLNQFTPLTSIPNVTFFSLQKGEPAEQAKNPPQSMTLIDFMDDVGDFADTAALIANLDLVIGVDTSVIHMAGALAKPVFMLSRFDGCWRWLLDRNDSPWYPTMTLFRQPKAGDWKSVIDNVRVALERVKGIEPS